MTSTEDGSTAEKPAGEDRDQWGNRAQFLLTCIGLAVGLGNIWRFPSLAYENGGSAFLFPYITCSLLFGLPCLYLEFVIGQYTRTGPSQCFKHYMPAMQGIGWSMILIAGTIGVYYTVIIAWTGVYLFYTWWHASKWARCDNEWNTIHCLSQIQNDECGNRTMVFFNGSCVAQSMVSSDYMNHSLGATEEYFERFILAKSTHLTDFNTMNWPVTLSLLIMWILLAIVLSKGVKWIGKVSYVTATVPYLIILALFIRSITLKGATTGISFYLGSPDFSKLFSFKTWSAALTQLCFSLSIGWGGLLSMSSYNNFKNNCFMDAAIVAFADSFMSVFGGCAVFGILGYLASELDKPIEQVVQSGLSLAFVAYPEAMARMPLPELWSYLFFLMLFFLGMSTQITIAECLCTGIHDMFPSTRSKKYLVVGGVCFGNFLCGLILCTDAGIFWFTIFNEFTGSTMLCIAIILEVVVVVYCYGVNNLGKDIIEMLGAPSNGLQKVLGSSGYYIKFCWLVTVPLMAMGVCITTVIRDKLTYGKGDRLYKIPTWGEGFGWFLAVGPGLAVPALFIFNWYQWNKEGKSLSDLFRIQPTLPSFDRLPGPDNKEQENDDVISSRSANVARSSRKERKNRRSSRSRSNVSRTTEESAVSGNSQSIEK